MKILSVTTSSNVCGISILENDKLICSLDSNTGRTHSENLMPMIDKIFKKTNLSLSDINLIVCDIGPGSFTGIRIGVASVKAFCDSLSIPCIGISSLEGLAYNVNCDGYICSLIDRKHDNCYFALYELHNGIYKQLIEPQASSIDNALFKLKEPRARSTSSRTSPASAWIPKLSASASSKRVVWLPFPEAASGSRAISG